MTASESPEPRKRDARVQIIRKNVKHARIMVHHDGQVHFVAPLRYSEDRIHQLVQKHAPWIDKQRQKFSTLARIRLEPGQILYRGKVYRFVRKAALGEEVYIYPEHSIICSGVDLVNPTILDEWYRSEAKRIIARRIDLLAERFNLPYTKLRVTSPKSIWGSCTAKHVISVNWRLIKAPAFVLDYLLLHELVHTEVADHSTRFWNRVAKVCPRYEEAVQWLKTYGRWI